MKTLYVTLTSYQLPPIDPQVLDHWFFVDPLYGATFTYPASCDGGDWSDPTTYTSYVCGGYFFPWGYQVVDQIQDITLKDLKGDTTIVFVPSAIDVTFHDVLKIVYDPGNGEQPVVINRPIISQPADFSDNAFLEIANIDSPTLTTQSFFYPASSSLVTYYPSITALYGDMTRLFYYYTVNVYPNSIYNIDDVHLVTTAQLSGSGSNSICTYEVESVNTLAINRLKTNTTSYPSPLSTLDSNPLVTFGQEYIVPLSA